jgi:protein-arginine kinase activator protein McsA
MNPIRKPQINSPSDQVKFEQIRTYLFALVDELNFTLFRQEREIAILREEIKTLREKQKE